MSDDYGLSKKVAELIAAIEDKDRQIRALGKQCIEYEERAQYNADLVEAVQAACQRCDRRHWVKIFCGSQHLDCYAELSLSGVIEETERGEE